MELYQLKTFVTVADLGHLTRAAEKLNISQPSVSAHIKALEAELGVALFSRTPKGMRLTSEGRVLKAQAEKALDTISELKDRAMALREELTGVVKIGLNTDPPMLRIGEFFSVMRGEYPGLECHLLQNQSRAVLEDIKSEKLDAGFIYGENPHGDITAVPLRRFDMMVIAPSAWKERLKGANWQKISELPWISVPGDCPFHDIAMDLFAKENIEPAKVAVADQESALGNLVASGVGLTLMIEEEARALEKEGKITVWGDPAATIGLSFVYMKRRSKEPALTAVREGIRQVWHIEE